ncbi:hypothetical protein LY90DRAFT_520320, partial [Neocallimastix californiae]
FLEVSEFTTIPLFLVVKPKARTDVLLRSDAEDVGEHSLRRVKPASSASTKRRKYIKKPLTGHTRPLDVLKLRNHFCCEFDYYRPELEDKEEIIDNQTLLFAGLIPATSPITAATATTPSIAVSTQDAEMEEPEEKNISNHSITEEPVLTPVFPTLRKSEERISQEGLFKKPVTETLGKRKNNPLEEERSPTIERYLPRHQDSPTEELNQFNLDEFNRLRTENAHLKNLYNNSKIEISNLTNAFNLFQESWKKDKSKLLSKISKIQNQPVALNPVLPNNSEVAPSRLSLEILEKKERIKKMIEEKKGKCKEITDSLKRMPTIFLSNFDESRAKKMVSP